ncbi:hypothetical protein ACP70R_013184 [Stipagrostis hirtigluma subsp. patula]
MGKTSQRLATRRQENSTGCMSGLIRMFYFRPDAKLLLDRKQGSRRHTFSGFAGNSLQGRGHSRKKSRDFEEIDEDLDNMEECSSGKPTVKRLMEDELGKVKQLKIPNDEVQRILADLGHDVCLDNNSVKNNKSKEDQNHNTSITVTSPSGSLDPNYSNCMKEAEENELELALADFLGQLQRCHDEWPHKNCKSKSDLCTELKSIIQTKLDELNNPPCSLAYDQTQSKEKDIADGKQIPSSREGQPKKFRDALEMLSSDTELLLKIIQKPNSHILEDIQRHQHRQIGTKLGPAKTLGNTDSSYDIKSPNQHELATKTDGKERKHIFFWKKERLNNGHTEGANSSQPINKIVILKPNPRIGFDPAMATSPNQAPELSAAENSKFSMKEVRRRFRIVASEARKGRPTSVHEDNLQKDPHLHKSSAFTIKKDTRQLTEKTSVENASSTATKDIRSSTSSRQKQINGESMFYEEAKKHLTEILKDKSEAAKYPTLQISRTLVRMLSLPQCSTASPASSPRAKGCIEISSEEANICAIHKAKKEEYTKEASQSRENSISVACSTSEPLHEKAVQERHHMKEESEGKTQDGAKLDTESIEEIDKLDRLGTRFIPEEQCRYTPSLKMVEEEKPGKEYVGVFPSSPGNVVDELEYQEPETPRSNVSIGLISQFFPEGNHEKQEQPSPVSVLDPFFHEDVDNPDSENMVKCELQEDILRTRYTVYDGSDQGISWDDEDVRLSYIKAVLELSELCAFQNLEVWYLEDELISPCLFEELYQGNQIHDAKLLFDCICEAVTEIQRTYFRSPPCSSLSKGSIKAPPMGQNLISEINKQVERHLHYQFPSTLDQLVNLDLKAGSWMDLQTESEEITVEIWDFILDDLLEEVIYDLWI